MTKTMTRTTVGDAREFVTHRVPFRAGTMTGDYLTAGTCGAGELPDEWRPAWHDAVTKYGRRLFVVRSFETPIAWRGDDGYTVIPAVEYGSRTARHQGIVRVAWSAVTTELPGEVQVRVTKVERANGSSAFRVFGPNGSRTYPLDYEAPLSGKFEAAAIRYAIEVCGMGGDDYFRVHERHSRFRGGRRFVILPD